MNTIERAILNSIVGKIVFFRSINNHTNIIISSHLEVDHSKKAQERIFEICKHLKAVTYINPIGGKDLYDTRAFSEMGLVLKFIKTENIVYDQQISSFVPNLSILDLLMHNDLFNAKKLLNQYRLID